MQGDPRGTEGAPLTGVDAGDGVMPGERDSRRTRNCRVGLNWDRTGSQKHSTHGWSVWAFRFAFDLVLGGQDGFWYIYIYVIVHRRICWRVDLWAKLDDDTCESARDGGWGVGTPGGVGAGYLFWGRERRRLRKAKISKSHKEGVMRWSDHDTWISLVRLVFELVYYFYFRMLFFI